MKKTKKLFLFSVMKETNELNEGTNDVEAIMMEMMIISSNAFPHFFSQETKKKQKQKEKQKIFICFL